MVNTQPFVRNRLTIYNYVTLAAYIWGVYGLGPALLLMRDETGMTRTMSSLHSTGLAVGIVIAGFTGAQFVRRLGRGGTLQTGALLASAGVLGLAVFRTPWLSLPSTMLLGLGGSIATNAMNAYFSVHFGRHAPAAIGESNAGAVLAGLLAPLAMGALVASNLDWRFALVVPVLMFGGARLFRGDPEDLEVQGESSHDVGASLPRPYWWAWLAMVLCVATEFSFVLWSGDVLRDQARVSTATAASSLSAVAIGMMLARLTISKLNKHFDIERVFLTSLLLPIVAWVPMWLSHNATVILSAMFVVGVGLGYHYPLTLNRMLVAAPGMPDAAAARSALASGLAIGGSPFALALLSNAFGLHTAFIMVPTLLTLCIALVLTHPVRH